MFSGTLGVSMSGISRVARFTYLPAVIFFHTLSGTTSMCGRLSAGIPCWLAEF